MQLYFTHALRQQTLFSNVFLITKLAHAYYIKYGEM